MSVGLLAVRLLYRFYVCVHLSKWFTFFSFLVVGALLSGRPLHLLPTYLLKQFAQANITISGVFVQVRGRKYRSG
jgi:hypothetical protein